VSIVRYSLIICAVSAGTLAALFALVSLERAARLAMAAGALIASVNAVAAYGLAASSLHRSSSFFLGAILGGMVGRMALMLAAAVLVIVWAGLPRTPFVISLLAYFSLFLVAELAVLHRMTTSRRTS
jgi:hypothetical protein